MAKRFYYEETIYNDYLGKVKTIKAQSLWELELKVEEQLAKWEAEEERQRKRDAILDMKDEAEFETELARKKIEEYKNILNHTLNLDDKLDWEKQKKTKPFRPSEFDKHDLQHFFQKHNVPKKSFVEYIFPFLRKKRERLEKIAQDDYNQHLIEYDEAYKDYLIKKEKYEKKQAEYNQEIEEWRKNFESGDVEAIEKYINVVLENSTYPEEINKEYEVQYRSDLKTVIVSYKLPVPNDVPKAIEFKYSPSKKEIVAREMKKKEFEEFYDSIIYQITLRTIHEIFESVYIDHVDIVVFNGWVDYIDEATGHDNSSCIISVQASRKEFESINLERVDYKKCIQNLKGLFAGKLAFLTPVKPILDIDREDNRFVESKDILSNLHSNQNLATMHWEDFEHLVRQLFEKMFNEDGAEVKVTQASRDGGVDAIAFDPDPIKGGKFVIQAKRYNNTVPVSAVRDLYGTMLHEGATKGILVTTSNFGKDALEFVKDKPITLINGQELLYLFNKYGYKDLKIVLNK
ncbi:restriction endonuclease [Anoxybacillus gonensis]|uniref:Restriction endonuclease n=1 Tax=Anoxybacillus gonensis TaxID=198467 RepID=A0AAW7TF26_9BACL|nr:restriction endonuclease [Anoxybacillus gonensis]AKS37383.1 restriction endonuclease [Anoxybacillus gonensis]KGP61321.1 restriction endonuclease [Anoxybacillus gonensis]MDO0876817.1 restriction endonuclease [Anoxybacillus gonensis]